MSLFYTERILTASHTGLQSREGLVFLDAAASVLEVEPLPMGPRIDIDAVLDPATELGSEHGPLHVDSGLENSDFIVFLGRHTVGKSAPEAPTPYLVTHVDSWDEGSGILVAVDRANVDPTVWVSDHPIQLASRLDLGTTELFDLGFGPRLIGYFRAKRI